ncbi:conserved hypothetical protein [Hyella patelloides LEGE 07179]|uniref:DUF2330 domain-containing protein n=1 Tax=Hyella patelloides LEGE 07179 TaxID=945734 RepID=A0A563W4K4_9CYAN|nr:DUF2330 domain-containing protein [Hyella patelloides]VEP18605.1 conserved hypothetical protein [Hyella patelloides LEGE 07179]
MKLLRILLASCLSIAVLIFNIQPVLAFCGFYVAKADSSLYNQASQVIIARDGQRTVLTMSNDYQGEVKDFAMVVPVPVILKEEQVNVGEAKIIERLDAFSAPRLVEYFDPDPCEVRLFERDTVLESAPASQDSKSRRTRQNNLGVTVEEQFTVGEYDIVILSAKESDGLETWLIQNGYKIPAGARELLQPYIKQNLKFFVAKVNLEEYNDREYQKLRPIAIAYESPKFMLPIRLGMANAQGDQDLIVYLLSPKGQIELTNYRTVNIPSNLDIPEFVQQEFKDFYTTMFQKTYQKENKKVAFLEYAWDMASCDPCSAEPLNPEELKQAGVFWLNETSTTSPNNRMIMPTSNVFITRLHVRYNRGQFPEDLRFHETGNRQLFQGRYVIRHPFRGEISCQSDYPQAVSNRQEQEAQNLANLTGWNIEEIRSKIDFVDANAATTPWWRTLWN